MWIIVVVIIFLAVILMREKFMTMQKIEFKRELNLPPPWSPDVSNILLSKPDPDMNVYEYKQIQNDACRGTVRVPYNFYKPMPVSWQDSGNGTPEITYVVG